MQVLVTVRIVLLGPNSCQNELFNWERKINLCPPAPPPPRQKMVFFQMPIEKEVSENFVAPASNDDGDVNENGQNQD